MEALVEIDSALAAVGLRKQIRSALVPGLQYAITYDGPTMEKRQIETALGALAKRHHLNFSVDVEESVSFP